VTLRLTVRVSALPSSLTDEYPTHFESVFWRIKSNVVLAMYEIACTLELFHILHRQIDSMVSTIILNIVSKKMDDLLFYTIYRFTIFKQFLCFIEIRIQYLATLNKNASLVWWRACLFKWGQSREAVYLYETELLKIYFAEWITVVNTLPVDLFLWCSCFWLAHRHYLQGYLTSSTKLAPLCPCDFIYLTLPSNMQHLTVLIYNNI
jgi:hypothetical protein